MSLCAVARFCVFFRPGFPFESTCSVKFWGDPLVVARNAGQKRLSIVSTVPRTELVAIFTTEPARCHWPLLN